MYDKHFTAYTAKAELEMTLKNFSPEMEDMVLDLGIGTGRFLQGYIDKCKEVIGVDFSFQSLLQAKKIYKRHFDNTINLIQADISRLPFKQGTFEKAISTQAIQHLPSDKLRKQAIIGIYNVLKQGAEFVCSTPNYSIQKRFYEKLGKRDFVVKEGTIMDGKVYCFNFKANELAKLFKPDFEVKEIHGILNWIPKISKNLGRYRKRLDYFIAKTPFSIWIGDIFNGLASLFWQRFSRI